MEKKIIITMGNHKNDWSVDVDKITPNQFLRAIQNMIQVYGFMCEDKNENKYFIRYEKELKEKWGESK